MAHIKYAYQKRHFLNTVLAEHTSYISALCESSLDGDHAYGLNMVTVADCRRVIELEFSLHTAQDRKQSLRKIDGLIATLTEFRAALRKEAELIQKGRR